MFLRKEVKHITDGKILVPFCNVCSSQKIKTVQTCEVCGSHDIKTDINDDRSIKDSIIEKEVPIYKCDRCGKEFDGFETESVISYLDGSFESFKVVSEYEDPIHYSIGKDLCDECKRELTYKLNREIRELINIYTVDKKINKFIKKEDEE